MHNLNESYYDAIVLTDEVDPNHAGAVRVKIFGVTDELKKEHQPYAIPAVSSLMAVPTKGTHLRVGFDEGDVNKPKYFSSSPEKSDAYLPKNYVDEYPNVAIANLGGDLFSMYHNRKSKDTLFTHPSRSAVIWNNFGTLVHDSEDGYENAGRGANEQRGGKIHPVLTEATIDPFCCTPVGSGDAFQGSEYLIITHVSRSTVDLINGESNANVTTDAEQFEPTGIDTSVINPLLNSSGNKVGEVTFLRSPTPIEINSERKPTHIFVGITGSNDFVDFSQKILDKNTQLSAHYLVGKQLKPPPSFDDPDAPLDDGDKSGGFAQFVELKNDTTYGNKLPSPKKPLLFPQVKGNKNAITVLVVGTSPNRESWKPFQKDTVNTIKEHVKYTFNIKEQDLIVQDVGFVG